ncbi:PIN domain-containing protein [Candidatus Gottesmanbacteria bacterium]|nr:PIN domain-containing protein [Candidatus Gottesmanbacteria bacterium]
MQYFIDTNIFLRSLYKENPKIFNECVDFIKAIKEKRLDAYTGTIILTEVVYTLKSFYNFEKYKIIQGLQGIINISGLKILDNYNQLLALDLYEKYSIKYVDALIASMSEVYDKEMIVVSYDRDFDKLPILAFTPGEVLKREKLYKVK